MAKKTNGDGKSDTLKNTRTAKPKFKLPDGVNAKTPDAMIAALEHTRGIVSHAATMAGINRDTHYQWMTTVDGYAARVQSVKNGAIDHVESKLNELIDGISVVTPAGNLYTTPPDNTSIIFYLKTQGKTRGWIEKQVIEHTGVEINITPDNDE